MRDFAYVMIPIIMQEIMEWVEYSRVCFIRQCATSGSIGRVSVAWKTSSALEHNQKIKKSKYRNVKISKCQNIRMSKCQNIKLSKYQNVEMSKYQNIKKSAISWKLRIKSQKPSYSVSAYGPPESCPIIPDTSPFVPTYSSSSTFYCAQK